MEPAELARACAHLRAALTSMPDDERRLRGFSMLGGSLDLCLFLRGQLPGGANGVRVATGPPVRARILPERIRHERDEWIEGETTRGLDRELGDASLVDASAFPAERRAVLRFATPEGERVLMAECFGPQGNWFLLDADDSILASARRPQGQRATLVRGARYEAPALPPGERAPEAAQGADPAWLEERARHYEEHDAFQRWEARRRQLQRGLRRERKGLDGRLRGIEERMRNEAQAEVSRREAELLLMQPGPGRRGLDRLVVTNWFEDGAETEISLDPKLDLKANAQKRFERARRLQDGAKHSERELRQVQERRDTLAAIEKEEASLSGPGDEERLSELSGRLAELGGRRQTSASATRARRKPLRKAWRSFRSRDGMLLWVGRTNRDNDELVRKARGHDVWLHVGEGLGGSHVLIRLPRGKTASLECLLEAGELAVHFSKARGRPLCEVLYTPAKWVRKRKGSAPGLVEVQQSKTLRIEHEPGRLARVLATLEDESA